MICALFGHNKVFYGSKIQQKLEEALIMLINNNYTYFYIGSHGTFDTIALEICRKLKKIYNITIRVVKTSMSSIMNINNKIQINQPTDYENIIFDIENVFYKQVITYSNKQMVNIADIILCYIEPDAIHSGAKTAVDYAKKLGKKIINLYN